MKRAPRAQEGSIDGSGRRFAIAASRFNESVTRRLVEGALDELTGCGVAEADITLVWVPGALELPLAAKKLAVAPGCEGVICVGCVIKGETIHDELVASAVVKGTTDVSLTTGVPVLFGVVTAETTNQALARAGDTVNRGREAALAALEMATVVGAL